MSSDHRRRGTRRTSGTDSARKHKARAITPKEKPTTRQQRKSKGARTTSSKKTVNPNNITIRFVNIDRAVTDLRRFESPGTEAHPEHVKKSD